MKRKLLKFLKYTFYILLGLFVILSILPYLLPVNKLTIDPKNPPFAESKFINIEGKRWHYRRFDTKDSIKGTMLLIHGFSGSTYSWSKNQEVFADSGFNVISVDLPAFGFSEKDHNKFDHSSYAHAANIWRLVDSIGLKKEKLIVFGHSMGAAVAWDMAGQKPERTEQVFLVDGAGNMGSRGKRSFSAAVVSFIFKYPPLLRWVDVIAGAYYFKQDKFEELLSSAYGKKADKEDAAGYLRPFLIKNSGRAVIEGFLYSKKNPEIDYNKINCPVHLIWGTKDNWVPIKVAESFMKKFPASKIQKFEGAGHCPMESHPNDFNNFILNCLKE